MASIAQLVKKSKRKTPRRRSRCHALQSRPQLRGTCLKVHTTTPRKPNSAIRKVGRVFLSNCLCVTVYIPGMSHNLQKHSVVFIRGGRVKDLPGVRFTAVRGKYDLQRLVLRRKGRSKYGTSLAKGETVRRPYRKTYIY